MIAFLLGLLKVIGIILLVVLILLLVIVGIVLFVPIRYSGAGAITEEKKEASAKVTWLLKAVQCGVDYTFPEKPLIKVKVLGIDVMKLLEKQKAKNSEAAEKQPYNKAERKETEKREPKKAKQKKQAPGINMSLLEPEPEIQVSQSSLGEAAQAQNGKSAEGQESDKIATTESIKQDADLQAAEASAKEKVPLKEKLQTIIDKVKNIIYNIQYYLGILQEEDTRQLITDAWESIKKILKSIAPREFKLEGVFGFATPDTTGKAYGMYTVVMPLLGEHVVLEPDFEKQVIQGNVALKGRITIFVIVVNALRIVFDKRLQPLIRKLKHGGNENGRK